MCSLLQRFYQLLKCYASRASIVITIYTFTENNIFCSLNVAINISSLLEHLILLFTQNLIKILYSRFFDSKISPSIPKHLYICLKQTKNAKMTDNVNIYWGHLSRHKTNPKSNICTLYTIFEVCFFEHTTYQYC